MPPYTTPVTATFQLQRQMIDQSRRAVEGGLAVQRTIGRSFVDAVEAQGAAQRRAVELNREVFHDALDVVAANVPGADAQVEDVRVAADEQYDQVLENHSEAFEALVAESERTAEAADDFGEDYLDALDEQLDLLQEAHEDLETQSVEAVERLAQQVEDLQERVTEVTDQVHQA